MLSVQAKLFFALTRNKKSFFVIQCKD
jgi:hypothetical protein